MITPSIFRLRWITTTLLLITACGHSAPSDDVYADHAAGFREGETAVLRVRYPTLFGQRITIRCSGANTNWRESHRAEWGPGDVWTARVVVGPGAHCKPLLDDRVWAKGGNVRVGPGETLDLWPYFGAQDGAVYRAPAILSTHLERSVRVWVYLPPSYEENTRKRYPVVYMQDGQNLFSDADAMGGISWNAAGSMDLGILEGSLGEAIVVGVGSSASRTWEYTPVPDAESGGGGGETYLSFLTDELKPWVDDTFRTEPARQQTHIVGSSLGGIAAIYAGLRRPDVFGGVGAMSPATWWADDWVIRQTRAAEGPLPRKVYLDSGDSGPFRDDLPQTAELAEAWSTKPGVDVRYFVEKGASHSEAFWRGRFPGVIRFLVGER